MANVKSDEMKQSLDNLEKYRLFTEGNLKPFIRKEFDQCGSLLRKRMLADFWHLFSWFHSRFLHFFGLNTLRKLKKASSSFSIISLFWNCYEKDSINKMNNGQAKPLSRVQKVKTY